MQKTIDNGERILPDILKSPYERMLYAKHLFSYEYITTILPSDYNILEIGCGEGYGSYLISKYFRNIIALDNNKETIDCAIKKYQAPNLKFIYYEGEILPFDDSSFDAVIAFQVIEHIKNDKAFVQQVVRILKDGGQFIATTPDKTYRLKPGQKPWYKYHIREYNKDELLDLLKPYFSNISIYAIKSLEDIFKIEKNVADLASFLSSIDIFNIRDLIGYHTKRYIINIFNNIRYIFIKNNNHPNKDFTTKDFFISNDFYHALDLLVQCKK